MGGADAPEDVQGGFNQALNLEWEPNSAKQLFLICDAPGHGKDICDGGDSYPNGSPDGYKIQDQMKMFAARKINFSIIRVNNTVDKMIKVMRENYDSDSMVLNVSDLEKSVATKSKAEVTKEFVAAASFILSATVGRKGGKAAGAVKRGEPLWEPKKFETGQWFSQSCYLTVKEITPARITVKNSFGDEMHVSRDILEKMDSANHFQKEVPLNMTELAELLENAGDTAFTVSFKKKVTEESVMEKLQGATAKDLDNNKFLAQLSKELTEGEDCLMTCHLVEAESSLGRSTVIDLTTSSPNKFRQVDHRTINYIIINNTKFVLKKGGKKNAAEESDDEMDGGKKKEAPKWNVKDLAVGNTFSGTSYYRATAAAGDNVTTRCQGVDITVSKDILECQMYNASVFAKEEKLSLTKVAQMLESANTACFTVCFTTKADEKLIKERL